MSMRDLTSDDGQTTAHEHVDTPDEKAMRWPQAYCVGFLPHIVSASDISFFLYLFICPLIKVLVTWFLVWVFRREKTGFQYTVSRLCFVGGHGFFQLEFIICK